MTTITQLHNEVTALRGEVSELRAEMRNGAGGVYQLSDYEREQVMEGLAEVRRGDIASDEKVNAMLAKHGLL